MPVPNTDSFSLQNVGSHLGLAATTDLIACFAEANTLPAYWWDTRYVGAKNSLLNFRNYGTDTNISIGNFESGGYTNMTTLMKYYNSAGTYFGECAMCTQNVWKSYTAGVTDVDGLEFHWIPASGYVIDDGVTGTLTTAPIIKIGATTIDFSPCTITGSYSGNTYIIKIENLQSDNLTFPNEPYVTEYGVRPLNSSGQQCVPVLAPDETAPTPGTLTWSVGVYWNSTTAALSWTAGSDNVGVTKIIVQQNYNGGAFSNIYTYTGAPPSTSSVNHTISRTNGGGYAYRIAYYDAENNVSYSNQRGSIYDIGVPTTVSGLANYGAPTTTSIYLVWTAATDSISGIAGYNIYSSTLTLLDTTSGTGVNWTNSGLTAGSTHAYYVKARDNAGNLSSSYSNLETTYTLTSAPTLGSSTITGTSIVVTRNSVSGAASYRLYWRISGGSWALATSAMGTSYTKTGLSESSTYEFYAQAANNDGYYSANSSTLTRSTIDTIDPTAPGTPTFSSTTTGGYTVSWTAATDASGIDYYEVSIDGDVTPFNNGSGLTYSWSASPGTTSSWRIRAVDNNGNTGPYGGTASWATKTIAPTLTFSSDTSTTQTFTKNTVTGGSTYRLYWKIAGGSYALATSSMGSSYTKTGLLPLTSYSYYLISRNAFGEDSAASTVVTNTTDGLLTPTGLAETADSDTSINMAWNAVEGATGYTVLMNGVTTYTTGVAMRSVTGLTCNTTYGFQVKATSTQDDSAYSGTVNMATNAETVTTPTSLAETSDTETSISMSWGASTSGCGGTITSYEVSTNLGAGVDTGSNLTYTKTGLVAGTSYGFRVRAISSFGGTSAYSGTVNMSTQAAIIQLSTPTGLAEVTDTDTSISMDWNGVTNNSGYRIARGNTSTVVRTNTTNDVTWTDTGLAAGATSYTYYVQAIGDGVTYSDSAWSAGVSMDTAPDTTAPSNSTISGGSSVTTTGYVINWTTSTDATSPPVIYDLFMNNSGTATYSGTATSYQKTGLTIGTSYNWKVRARDSAASPNYATTSANVGIMTLCAGLSLSSSAITSSSITISWPAVTGASAYRIAWRPSGGSYTYINNIAGLSTVLSGLSASTTYEFYGSSYNAQSIIGGGGTLASASTTAAADTTAPTTPGTPSISGTQTSTTATLTWTASTDAVGVTGYQVYRNGSLHKTTATNSVSVDAVTAGQEDVYKVRAYDAATNYSAFSADFTVYFAPIALTLVAGSTTQTTMSVSWTFVGSNAGIVDKDVEISYEFAATDTDFQQASDQESSYTSPTIDVTAESGGDAGIRMRLNVSSTVKGAWSNWVYATLVPITTV